MAVDKKVNYDVQGGVKNYLGKQKQVKAPLKWQSSPDHPTTELAYITEAEKDLLIKSDLHGSLKGGVNKGPSGIISLNGFGSTDSSQNVSGAAASAAESGRNTSDTLAAGMSNQDVQDFQAASVAAGAGQRVNPGFFDSRNTVSPDVLARAKTFAPQAFKSNRSNSVMDFITGGGIIGAGIRGLGQKLGLGKQYNQPTYDISEFNNYELGGSQTPTYYNDLDNELMLSTKETPSTLDLDKSPNKFNRMFNINNIASLIEASQGIDTSMYGADQDIYGVENARGLFRPYQQSTDFNTKYSPDGLTYYNNDEQPEGIIGIDVGYDNPAFENDSMVKLDNAETREKTTLQMGKDLGLNSPSQNEKLEQLKQKEKEAALNTTSIV